MPDLSNLANNPRLQALRDDPELADFFHDLEAEGMNGAMRCAAAAAPCASHGVRSRLTPPRPPPLLSRHMSNPAVMNKIMGAMSGSS